MGDLEDAYRDMVCVSAFIKMIVYAYVWYVCIVLKKMTFSVMKTLILEHRWITTNGSTSPVLAAHRRYIHVCFQEIMKKQQALLLLLLLVICLWVGV